MRNVRPFFSLHSVPVELTWIGCVPFATNLLVDKRICKNHLIFKLRNASLAPFLTGPMRLQKCQRFHFGHPFTWMVAGINGSVKTAWPRSLLQQTSESIYLRLERIVWYYSQWQPEYTEMLVAIPHIEYSCGFENYFDVNKRNLKELCHEIQPN